MRRQGSPVIIGAQDGRASLLKPCPFDDRTAYDEAWLQALIDENPNVLPIWEIEPAFWPAFPVCRELALPSGQLDNLLLTPAGDLVLVECKLWRNPEARRKVVAQIIDYGKDLTKLDYAAFERAVMKARGISGGSLYGLLDLECTERQFVDAVSRNLRRGRALLIIAGDGITEGVEAIAEFLQQHAGIHFTWLPGAASFRERAIAQLEHRRTS